MVGKTAIYQGEREAIYAGYLIRVRCGPHVLPSYMVHCLNGPSGRDYCWRVKTDGVSQSNINAKKLADIAFLLPSLEEQQEIVRCITAQLEWLDNVGSQVRRADKLLERLNQSVLAKAFRGELTGHSPTKGQVLEAVSKAS